MVVATASVTSISDAFQFAATAAVTAEMATTATPVTLIMSGAEEFVNDKALMVTPGPHMAFPLSAFTPKFVLLEKELTLTTLSSAVEQAKDENETFAAVKWRALTLIALPHRLDACEETRPVSETKLTLLRAHPFAKIAAPSPPLPGKEAERNATEGKAPVTGDATPKMTSPKRSAATTKGTLTVAL